MAGTRRDRRNSKAAIKNNKDEMSFKDFSQMRHRFYIVRPEPNKTCVPMIALDELPVGFRLKGVPMTVSTQEISDWDMARVGADVELRDSFQVDFDRLTLSQHLHQSGHENKHSPTAENTETSSEVEAEKLICGEDNQGDKSDKLDGSVKSNRSNKSGASGLKTEADWVPISELQQQANEAANDFVEQTKWEKDNDRSKTQDAMTPGIYGKKKFCTHWIRTGNCDYMQEGCRYLHVIPDAETRLKIGIRDMPRWAKEDLPSPPREIHRGRRHSSTSPKESKKDSQKEWRKGGNRKAHAEVLADTPWTRRPAPMRPSTPTPQRPSGDKQHDLQCGINQTASISGTKPATFAAKQHLDPGKFADDNAQHKASPSESFRSATALQSSTTSASQESFIRQQQFNSLLSNSTPFPTQSPTPPAPYLGPTMHFSHSYGYGTAPPVDKYSAAFHPTESTNITRFGFRDVRLDGERFGNPFYQTQNVNPRQPVASRLTAGDSPFPPHPWMPGSPASMTPSISECSVGPIGHGRPSNSDRNPSEGMASPPIMHKRFFVQPGESQFVKAQPESKGPKKSDSRQRAHNFKGRGMNLAVSEESGGRSEQLVDLLTFGGDGN